VPLDKTTGNTYIDLMSNQDLLSYISIDSRIRFGKPCIKGTRISVGDILEWLSEGMTIAEIIDDYPLLTETHIRAALAFAARREEVVTLLAA
jgi:uncharacterized protein (DUF433 family)